MKFTTTKQEQQNESKAAKVLRKISKVIFTLAFALFALCMCVPSDNKEEPNESEEVQVKQGFDLTNAELNAENVKKAIDIESASVDIYPEGEKTIVEITFAPGSFWDEEALITGHCSASFSLFEKVFKNPEVDRVWVWREADFNDKYGNSSVENAVGIAIDRDTYEKINFENMKYKPYQDKLNIVDYKYIHPGILNNL